MKNLFFTVLTLAAASTLWGQDSTIDHAAATVAHLHDEMLNPASFVLDGVFLTKPHKRTKQSSLCYEYRSQNVSGGVSAGRAVEDGGDKGRLSTFTITGLDGQTADDLRGYNAGWVAPCKNNQGTGLL